MSHNYKLLQTHAQQTLRRSEIEKKKEMADTKCNKKGN